MRIGFNAQIVSPRGAGVAVYAKNLLSALIESVRDDEIVVFGSEEYLSSLNSPNLRPVATRLLTDGSAVRIAWEQAILPSKMRKHGVDVMFFPDHTAPLFSKSCPVIITIHDLAFLAQPKAFRPFRRYYKSVAVRRSVERADAIVAVSEATKRECLRFLPVAASRIHVIHNGLDPRFTILHDEQRLGKVKRKLGLPDHFILFVGTLEPRKNVVGLVRAFSQLNRSLAHLSLVIVGSRGWLYDEIFEEVERLRIADRVRFLDFVGHDDLVSVYNLSELFVYPSLYEGFGFPPLEAMACGVPVITSNVSSMPEIVGDAAVLVDPHDTQSLARAIEKTLEDPTLRADLKERGLHRSKEFTWRATALAVLDLYRRVARMRGD